MWIEVVPVDEATGLLEELYEQQTQRLGRPTEITMLGSLFPELVEARTKLYHVVESCPSSLAPSERQAVALAAAGALGSDYIISGVEAKFLSAGGSRTHARALEAGSFEGLGPAAAALARYARKVAQDPISVSEEDVMACRAAGASDLDVLDANNLAGYYAYLARVCLGLGVRDPLAS